MKHAEYAARVAGLVRELNATLRNAQREGLKVTASVADQFDTINGERFHELRVTLDSPVFATPTPQWWWKWLPSSLRNTSRWKMGA